MFFLILHILISSSFGLNNYCSNFADYACDEKNIGRSDGTGKIKNHEEIRKLVLSEISKVRKEFDIAFDKFSQQNEDFQKEVFAQSSCSGINFQSRKTCPAYLDNIASLKDSYFSKALPKMRHKFGPPLLPEVKSELGENRKLDVIFRNGSVDAPILNRTSEFLFKRLSQHHRRDYLTSDLFEEVRSAMKEVIGRLPESPEKIRILARIDEVQPHKNFGFFELYGIFDTGNLSYQNDQKTITIDLGSSLHWSSLFPFVNIIGHEFAHSIDSCNLPKEHQKAFGNLVKCLEQNRHAFPSGKLPPLQFEGKGCKNPIDENFGDWFGVETLSVLINRPGSPLHKLGRQNLINGLANSMPLCASGRVNSSHHGADQFRLEMILSNPDLRSKVGCVSAGRVPYCTFNSPSPQQGSEKTIESNP